MKRSPFAYVRDIYGVPAYRGARVWYLGTEGRIVWASSYIHVRFPIAAARTNPMLRAYLRPSELRATEAYPGEWSGRRTPRATIRVQFHPCDSGLGYDRETPAHRWPRDPRGGIPGWGYFVWATVCEGFGIELYSPASYHPAIMEPWPCDPRTRIVATA